MDLLDFETRDVDDGCGCDGYDGYGCTFSAEVGDMVDVIGV